MNFWLVFVNNTRDDDSYRSHNSSIDHPCWGICICETAADAIADMQASQWAYRHLPVDKVVKLEPRESA